MPRSQEDSDELLASRLAIDPNGIHIPGIIGSVSCGGRRVGTTVKEVPILFSEKRTTKQRLLFLNGTLIDRLTFQRWTNPEMIGIETRVSAKNWPVYFGEIEERKLGNPNCDELPAGHQKFSMLPGTQHATNPKMSSEAAVGACDFIVDKLDEGSSTAIIEGRSGSQPADPDTAVSGTELFTLVMNATAFGNAVDNTGSARATANAIVTSDAVASDTLGYCRMSASNDGAAPLDDHLDGKAELSGGDFNFSTLDIVSGVATSMDTLYVSVSE